MEEKKELSRMELATVKRTAQNVKSLRKKKAKLEERVEKDLKELSSVTSAIDMFEAPIVEITGGFTSEQVLDGTMDLVNSGLAEMPQGEVDVETPVEEKVEEIAEEVSQEEEV